MDTKKIIVLIVLAGVTFIYTRKAAAQTSGGSASSSVLDAFFSPINAVLSSNLKNYGVENASIFVYRSGVPPAWDSGYTPLSNLYYAWSHLHYSAIENETMRGSPQSKSNLAAAGKNYIATSNRVGAGVAAQLVSPIGEPMDAKNRAYIQSVLNLYAAEAAPSGGLGGLGSLITFSNAKTAASILA